MKYLAAKPRRRLRPWPARWLVIEAGCRLCGMRFVAVGPLGMRIPFECPRCGQMKSVPMLFEEQGDA